MEYVDYMGLSDDLFCAEILMLSNEKNRENFQFLKDRPFIMDRFKNLISNNFVKGDKKRSSHNFIKYYNSYVVLSNVLNVISDPSRYYDDERIRVFNSYNSLDGDIRGLSVFSKEEKEKIKYVLDGYNMSKKISLSSNAVKQYGVKYDNIVSLLKRILNFYSKYGNSDKFYSLLYDDMKIKLSSFNSVIKYTKLFYCQELCSGTNIINSSLFDHFSLDEICLLEDIYCNYSDVFKNYTFKLSDDCFSISDYEKLFKLFDLINTSLSRRKGLEYAAGYISNNLKISLNEVDTYYYSVFKNYCNYKLIGFDCESELKDFLDKRKFKFLDISNFSSVVNMYRELTHRSIYLCELLSSNRKNMDNLINIIYDIKFFNKITPSMNHCSLASRIRFLNDDEKEKCNKFVLGYKEYYYSKKDLLEDEERQESINNEIRDMDLYVNHVKLFLDSGCDSIDSYFGENYDDKESFVLELEVLKKHGHPIYQRYIDYLSFIHDESYNRMVGDCKEIVNLINNGVLLSNGEKREFDLVDFYLFTDLSKRKFMNIIKDNVSSEEYANVSCFFSKYKGEKKIEGNMIESLYLNKVLIPNGWDSEGNVISYHDVTKEEKMDTIITIGKMGIPLTTITYGIMLRKNVEKIISEKDIDEICMKIKNF